MSVPVLLLLNLSVTAMLTGLIWTIQLVHYPGFADVGSEQCFRYQAKHMRRISFLVGPLMLAELLLAGWLLFQNFALPPLSVLSQLAAACVLVIWLLTALLFVPLHRKFEAEGYTAELVNKLVRRNWWRTALWTFRLLLLFGLTLFYL